MEIEGKASRNANRETEYTCLCGETFRLKRKVKHQPKCESCSRTAINEKHRLAEYHKKPRYKTDQRERRLKSNYGITSEEYNLLLNNQKDVCGICGKKEDSYLCVDHDHATGKVRGLLCHNCNRGLGLFKDSKTNFEEALKYLTTPSASRTDEALGKFCVEVSKLSPDESTKCGALIVSSEGIILSEGFNRFTLGIENRPERQERPLKYKYFEHAEREAVYKCAKYGIKTLGTIMWVTGIPCADCARGIIQAGIKEVVAQIRPEEDADFIARWKESTDFTEALFEEAGIKLRRFTI